MNKIIDVRNTNKRIKNPEITVMRTVGTKEDECRIMFGNGHDQVEVMLTVQQADLLRNLLIRAGAYAKDNR